jgi:hypothetical protein
MLVHLEDSSSDNEDDVICLNDFMRTESLEDSFLEVLKHRSRNLIESKEIIMNAVALKGLGKGRE